MICPPPSIPSLPLLYPFLYPFLLSYFYASSDIFLTSPGFSSLVGS